MTQDVLHCGVMLVMTRAPAVICIFHALAVLCMAQAPAPPVVNDPALKIELFAQEPMVQQPIGMTFTRMGSCW